MRSTVLKFCMHTYIYIYIYIYPYIAILIIVTIKVMIANLYMVLLKCQIVF